MYMYIHEYKGSIVTVYHSMSVYYVSVCVCVCTLCYGLDMPHTHTQCFATMINHMIMFVIFEECHLLIVTIFMTLCFVCCVVYTYSMCRCSIHPFQCDESSEGGEEVVG